MRSRREEKKERSREREARINSSSEHPGAPDDVVVVAPAWRRQKCIRRRDASVLRCIRVIECRRRRVRITSSSSSLSSSSLKRCV